MKELLLNNNSQFLTIDKNNLENLVSLVEELVINKSRVEKVKNELSNNVHSKILEQEIRIISQIQDTVKVMNMLKMKTVYSELNSFIEKVSQENSKVVNIEIEGYEAEIESTIINYITNLMKCFIEDIIVSDFETLEDKINKIKIQSFSDNKNLTISIESNGKGFEYKNVCKVMEKEILDIVSLNETELEKFISLTGIKISLDNLLKIRSIILNLSGSIKVEGENGKYRRITTQIPMTSSITQALLVKISNQIYAVPLEFIETIMNRNSVKIKVANNVEMINYMNRVIPLIRISNALNIKTENESECLLIVKSNNQIAALLIDSLLEQSDVVIKPKPSVISDIKEYKGTTILGDGLVTLVLDVASLIEKSKEVM